MGKKLKALAEGKTDRSQFAEAVRESAQQIWLAGLGAFGKAQEEGGKVFETLVKEGSSLQKLTREMTQGRIHEATGKFGQVAGELGRSATQSLDKLEKVFEQRVQRALESLGVPNRFELDKLIEQVQRVSAAVGLRTAARKTAADSDEPSAAATKKRRASAGRRAGPAGKTTGTAAGRKTGSSARQAGTAAQQSSAGADAAGQARKARTARGKQVRARSRKAPAGAGRAGKA